jgi:hypothetical protein
MLAHIVYRLMYFSTAILLIFAGPCPTSLLICALVPKLRLRNAINPPKLGLGLPRRAPVPEAAHPRRLRRTIPGSPVRLPPGLMKIFFCLPLALPHPMIINKINRWMFNLYPLGVTGRRPGRTITGLKEGRPRLSIAADRSSPEYRPAAMGIHAGAGRALSARCGGRCLLRCESGHLALRNLWDVGTASAIPGCVALGSRGAWVSQVPGAFFSSRGGPPSHPATSPCGNFSPFRPFAPCAMIRHHFANYRRPHGILE